MTDDRKDALTPTPPHLARNFAVRVVSELQNRQHKAPNGTRRFVLDPLVRSICKTGAFDPAIALDILRGHRIPVDQIIENYIPQAARQVGEFWIQDRIGFATVTIAVMRLQAVLAEATGHFVFQPMRDVTFKALIVVPPEEQHFLGASVVAAQLRRLGCGTEVSFAETDAQVRLRIQYDSPDMVLYTCACAAGLETIGKSVLGIRNKLTDVPVIAVGGAVNASAETVLEITGADLVTNQAKDVMAFCAQRRKAITV